MKRYTILSIFTVVCTVIFAQGTTVTNTNEQYVPNNEPEISFDAESPFNDIYIPAPQVRSLDNILWKKTVWRIVDMREQVNYPLYYPLLESNGRVNLFTTIFNLLKEGKISAYEYFEEKEDFSDDNKFDFETVLEKTRVDVFDVVNDADGNPVYSVNPSDIPSAQVLKFYIKEIWYFDAIESCMKFKIEAIAPQLYYTNDDGIEEKEPIYWIPFDQLRPWLARQAVVINNKNTTSFISYDDLFQKRRFVGHIYKEDNIQNRTIIQYCNTPEEVHSEQIRIEHEIMNFEFDLWEH